MAKQEKNQGHSNAFLEVLDSLETTLNSSGLIVRSAILTFAYPASPEIVLAQRGVCPARTEKPAA